MGHYDQKKKDCTNKGNSHTWSDLKVEKTGERLKFVDGTLCLEIKYRQYRTCRTMMEYHGGRGIGMTEGRRCEILKDEERKTGYIPILG